MVKDETDKKIDQTKTKNLLRHATFHHTPCIHEIVLKSSQHISRLSQHPLSDLTEIVPTGTEKWILKEESSV